MEQFLPNAADRGVTTAWADDEPPLDDCCHARHARHGARVGADGVRVEGQGRPGVLRQALGRCGARATASAQRGHGACRHRTHAARIGDRAAALSPICHRSTGRAGHRAQQYRRIRRFRHADASASAERPGARPARWQPAEWRVPQYRRAHRRVGLVVGGCRHEQRAQRAVGRGRRCRQAVDRIARRGASMCVAPPWAASAADRSRRALRPARTALSRHARRRQSPTRPSMRPTWLACPAPARQRPSSR